MGDAKERYLYFSQTREVAVERLPISILASFLDMKPQTLLKLKKELENEISDDESKSLMAKLADYLLINQSYKDSKMNSAKFANVNNISQKKLNTCINQNLNLNFKDFINGYRIAHFKELLLIESNVKNLTVDAMAAIAGFSSRSSFYLACKKHQLKIPKLILYLNFVLFSV